MSKRRLSMESFRLQDKVEQLFTSLYAATIQVQEETIGILEKEIQTWHEKHDKHLASDQNRRSPVRRAKVVLTRLTEKDEDSTSATEGTPTAASSRPVRLRTPSAKLRELGSSSVGKSKAKESVVTIKKEKDTKRKSRVSVVKEGEKQTKLSSRRGVDLEEDSKEYLVVVKKEPVDPEPKKKTESAKPVAKTPRGRKKKSETSSNKSPEGANVIDAVDSEVEVLKFDKKRRSLSATKSSGKDEQEMTKDTAEVLDGLAGDNDNPSMALEGGSQNGAPAAEPSAESAAANAADSGDIFDALKQVLDTVANQEDQVESSVPTAGAAESNMERDDSSLKPDLDDDNDSHSVRLFEDPVEPVQVKEEKKRKPRRKKVDGEGVPAKRVKKEKVAKKRVVQPEDGTEISQTDENAGDGSENPDPMIKREKQKYKRRPRQCDLCGKTVLDLGKHMMYHEGGPKEKLGCPYCDYTTVYKENLYRHKQVKHSTERPHLCQVCGVGFVNKLKLRNHVSLEHEGGREKRHQCKHCPFITHNIYILRRHVINVHEERSKYDCPICGLRLSYKDTFETHMRRHTGIKPYKCELCTASFNSSSCLNQHRRTHREKSFQCMMCGKKFGTKHHMTRHMEALHSNSKEHQCPFCRYTCNNKYNLRKHCKAQHDKTYPPMSRAEWRGKLPVDVGADKAEEVLVDMAQAGMTTVVDETGVTLHIKDGSGYIVNADGQLIQTGQMVEGVSAVAAVEAEDAQQEIIYIKPEAPRVEAQQEEVTTLNLEGAEVIKQEHIPVTAGVWENLQSAMGAGADMSGVNLEELLKGNNVLIQVAEEQDIGKEGEEVTYLVIEPQADTVVATEATALEETQIMSS